MAIYSEFSHKKKLWFSIAMLVYQRVSIFSGWKLIFQGFPVRPKNLPRTEPNQAPPNWRNSASVELVAGVACEHKIIPQNEMIGRKKWDEMVGSLDEHVQILT